MSHTEEVSNDKTIYEESGSANFLFINIEESIKKENVEEEQENVEGEGRVTETLQEDSQKAVKAVKAVNSREAAQFRAVYPNLQAVWEVETEAGEKTSPAGSEGGGSERVCAPEGESGADLNSRNTNQAFPCDKCFISFVSPVFLEGHRNRCRGSKTDENTQAEDTGDAPLHACDTDTQRKVKSRVPIGELKHKCKTCGRGFVRLKSLKAHEPIHAKVFKCDDCAYTTDHPRNLKRHIVAHYGEEKKIYACPHCSYTAGKSTYLRKHIARHAEEKQYKCHVCSYETAVVDNLTTHMAIHGGEKAFSCSHCYYSTARKAQLVKHLEKYHSAQSANGT